jgi:hypothetical protein
LIRSIIIILVQTLVVHCGICQTSYRPKLAEFGIETLRDYDVKSNSESLGNATNEIDEDRLIKAKLGIPILIKKDRLFGLQLKYYQHRFEFDQEDQVTNDDLFQHLDTRKFTSAGIRFFYQQDVRTNHQFRIIGGSELKSDEFQLNQNTTKHFISGTYCWKPSATTEFGTGVVVNRVMGITAVYPLFLFNKDLTPKWALNLTLPKSASMRYNLNQKNFLIATAELRGWRYNLTEAVPTYQRNLMLRRVDLQFSVSWEHEIHDWLWFGVDVGYNKNLQYFVANPGDRSRDALINLRSQDAAYTKLSLFIVPPRKFFN